MKRFICLSMALLLLCSLVGCSPTPKKAVGEYNGSDVRDWAYLSNEETAYKIGADKNGFPVFLDPNAAYKQAKKDLAEGFKQLQDEFELKPVSKRNYEGYKNLGWQTRSDNENIEAQCHEITCFFDIYENSYD